MTEVRDYVGWPKVAERLSVLDGSLNIQPTSATHISLSNSSGSAMPDWPISEALTVRGIAYAVHAHAYTWADGQWHVGRENEPDYRRLSDGAGLYATRPGAFSSDVSDSARQKMAEAIAEAVQVWADTNADVLREAAIADAHQTARRAETDLAELDAKRRELRSTIRKADRTIARLSAPTDGEGR